MNDIDELIDGMINSKYDAFFGNGVWEKEYKTHIITFAKQCTDLVLRKVEHSNRWRKVENELPIIPNKLPYGHIGIRVLLKYHQVFKDNPHKEKQTERVEIGHFIHLSEAQGGGDGFSIEHSIVPYKVTHWKPLND